MKKIGLIGGTSWQSTLEYYRLINQMVESRQRGHSARIQLESLDFAEVESCVARHRFDELSGIITGAALNLSAAGAEWVLLCANTLHLFAPDVAATVDIPLIHIAKATMARIQRKELKTVGLLGTRFTMEQDFYKKNYTEQGIELIVPRGDQMDIVNNIIFSELFKGVLNPDSKEKLLEIIESLARAGSQGIVLGCTELPLLLRPDDISLPSFDTTEIHAAAAVDFALS